MEIVKGIEEREVVERVILQDRKKLAGLLPAGPDIETRL